jgi:hypothetical protein
MRIARRDGSQLAASAIVRNSNDAAANEITSTAPTPHKTPCRRRAAPKAITTPAARLTSTARRLARMTTRRMSCFCAPIAIADSHFPRTQDHVVADRAVDAHRREQQSKHDDTGGNRRREACGKKGVGTAKHGLQRRGRDRQGRIHLRDHGREIAHNNRRVDAGPQEERVVPHAVHGNGTYTCCASLPSRVTPRVSRTTPMTCHVGPSGRRSLAV